MPLSKLEDFVSGLFASQRVMFQLAGIDAQKSLEQLLPYKPLLVEKEFPTDFEAPSASYDIPEASVVVVLTLHALELDEVAAIEAPAEDGFEDDELGEEYYDEDEDIEE